MSLHICTVSSYAKVSSKDRDGGVKEGLDLTGNVLAELSKPSLPTNAKNVLHENVCCGYSLLHKKQCRTLLTAVH